MEIQNDPLIRVPILSVIKLVLMHRWWSNVISTYLSPCETAFHHIRCWKWSTLPLPPSYKYNWMWFSNWWIQQCDISAGMAAISWQMLSFWGHQSCQASLCRPLTSANPMWKNMERLNLGTLSPNFFQITVSKKSSLFPSHLHLTCDILLHFAGTSQELQPHQSTGI